MTGKNPWVFLHPLFIILVFSAISASASYYLWIQQVDSGVGLVFSRACTEVIPTPAHSYRLNYTGVPAIDAIGCVLVSFFMPTITGEPNADIALQVFTFDVLFAAAVPIFFLLIDSASLFPDTRTCQILVPLIANLLYQLGSGGIVFPIYYLFSLLLKFSTGVRGQPTTRPDSRAVQAALTGVLVGLVLPTTWMLTGEVTPNKVFAWQPFPIYIAIIQAVFFALMPSDGGVEGLSNKPTGKPPQASTYLLIQFSYLVLTAIGSVAHIPFLVYLLTPPSTKLNPFSLYSAFFSPQPSTLLGIESFSQLSNAFRSAFLPDLHPHSGESEILRMGIASVAKRLLQMNAIFIGLATWLAAAWSWAFYDVQRLAAVTLISTVSGLVFGPGVLLPIPLMFKEWNDERIRHSAAEKPRGKKE